jgi:hypothetical protein
LHFQKDKWIIDYDMSSQKIFFSYSRADSPFALTLAKDLREAGADIWIDQLDIPAGSHWDAAVEKALNSAAFVLVILTNSSTGSTNVMDEVSFALESGKKIIPVLLEDCLPPFRLRRLQRIDFTSDYAVGFTQLMNTLSLSPGAFKPEGASASNPSEESGRTVSAKDTHDREKRDNSHWEEACRVNTIASYRKYLNEFHDGLFTDEAKLMIKQLEVEQKEEELEAMLWQKAKNENSKNLYQHYLQEYPQGNYKTLALAAIAEFEKEEREEERKRKEIAQRQEQERQQKAKEEKEKQDQLEREKAQKVKEEKERQALLEKERQQKAKEEKDRLAAIERENAQKAKEEKERLAAIEREKAQKEKAERDRLAAIEKEKAQKEKAEKDRLAAIEKEKARREKEEQDKIRKAEKEKVLLAKQQEKERINKERQAQGLPPLSDGKGKKYAMIAAGILLLCVAVWGMTRKGPKKDDKTAWKEAMSKNDSTAFATYMANFPEGKYYTLAKERIDSLYWVQRAIQDSLEALNASKLAEATPNDAPPKTEPVVEEPKKEPETKPVTETKPKTNTNTPNKPKTNPPAEKPTNKPDNKPKPSDKSSKVVLGQEHGGGIVIYVNANGDHGMIVSSKEVGNVDWEKAKKICAAYKEGNVGGWRLPSKDELNIIYQNRKHLGNYNKGNYWSSTEEGKNSATTINFSNGNQTKSNKQSNFAVRAVRPF